MSGNRKDWRWCGHCRKWVFDFPFAVGSICDACWWELCQADKNKDDSKAATEYLEHDYAKQCL